MRAGVVAALLILSGCSNKPFGSDGSEIPGFNGLENQIEQGKVGRSSDQWIEIKNSAGEWERVGLIFGYFDDYDECLKAIAGLKQVNFAREYRCVPAN
jgi:hypothetical protein